MNHLLASTARIEAEEAERAAVVAGWQPAGPPLTDIDQPSGEHGVPWDNPVSLGLPADAPPRAAMTFPSIGHIVVYHVRDGDSRNRRTKFPAIVMDAEPETGLLKLWIIVDDGDTWMQDHVPARVSPEPGWELVAPLPHSTAAVGDYSASAGVPYGLEDRIAALEAHAAVSVPQLVQEPFAGSQPVKRGPGRPRKV